MNSGDKALKIINIVVVTLIIITLLLAGNFFIQGAHGLGATFGGMLIVFSYIYWQKGIDYFEVKWLQYFKTQK